MDPDPGVPKTIGSYGSGSETMLNTHLDWLKVHDLLLAKLLHLL